MMFYLYLSALKEKYEHVVGSSATKTVEDHHHEEDESGAHAVIGLALVLGFVFMLLVDQIGSAHSRGIAIINFLGILNDILVY